MPWFLRSLLALSWQNYPVFSSVINRTIVISSIIQNWWMMVLCKIWQLMCSASFYNMSNCNPCPTTMASPPPQLSKCHATIPPTVQRCDATEGTTGRHGRWDNGTKVRHIQRHSMAMGQGNTPSLFSWSSSMSLTCADVADGRTHQHSPQDDPLMRLMAWLS